MSDGGVGQRLWSTAVSTAVLPAGDRVLGQRMMQRFRYLDTAQWWSRQRILAERDRSLVALVRVAATEVPFYRDLYAAASIRSEDVRTAFDLAALPTVGKAELREGYPDRTTRPTGQATYDECSAGSTGEPFCVKEDAETAGWYRASFLQILSWTGWRPGQPHLQLGMNVDRRRGRMLKDRLLRCSYVSSVQLDNESLDLTLRLLAQRRIRYLFGYPVAVFELARRAQERERRISLDAVVTWGDNLDVPYRCTIEDAFHTKVLDAYGCAEGMWIASQCGRSSCYHVHSLDVVLELLDDAGRPVVPGTPGNVVVTRLHPGPSPLIRYRTGDLAIASTSDCPCGRGYESIATVVGRSADTIVTPSGNRLIVHFFTGILEHYPEIASFQVAKVSPNCLEVRVVARRELDARAAARITADITTKAPDVRVELVVVDRLPLTTGGKRRFVVDET